MKEVLLLRHGKSDWNADYGGDDHERPLNDRGEDAAKAVGKFLREADRLPDLILCSTALRARDTAERAAKGGKWTDVPITHLAEFYSGGPDTLLGACRALDEDVRRVLLVGHEPTWSSTVNAFIGSGDVRMPTAALASVAFEIEAWPALHFGGGTLQFLIPPRLFEAWPG